MFKEGQIWRCRDRRLVEIICVLHNVDNPVVARGEKGEILRYTESGHLIGKHHLHDADMIGVNKNV